MKRIVQYVFMISILCFTLLLITYGILTFLLSTTIITSDAVVRLRDILFPGVYITFFVAVLSGLMLYNLKER